MSGKEMMIGDKPLSSLRVVDLKEELEKRGLSKSGSKKDLVDRLRNYVQVELQKQGAAAAAAANEEELPNISMQEKLAEQNPFIRDYFASQAELFHSQKVAKKLIEEARLSEAIAPSAEEVESSAPEPEDKGNSELESTEQPERTEAPAEKPAVVERLEDPPSEVKETPKEDKEEEPVVEASVEKEASVEIEEPSEEKKEEPMVKPVEKPVEVKPSEEEKAKQPVKESVKPTEQPNNKMAVEDAEKPSDEEKEKSPSPSSASSRSRSRSRSAEVEDENPPEKETKPAESESSSEEDEKETKPIEQNGNNVNNTNVKKLTELFETNDGENNIEKVESPVKKVAVEEESSKSTEDDKEEAESSSRSSSRSGSRSPIRLPKPVETGRKREASPVKEPEGKVRRLAERFENKPKEDVSETDKKPNIINSNKEVHGNKIIKAAESNAEPKLKESSVASKENTEVRTVRKVSVRTTEVEDDEEALDYGEEDKIKSEPAKFDWSRRIIRVKSKHNSKGDSKRWQRDVDPKLTENINTEFLSQYFPTVKLVSATELRLEEKEASPPTGEKVEITRKFSIESEEEGRRPIKMENITITRRVSLIPMVKTEPDEDDDKDLPPARNPATQLILITNLVRPFTLPQLKELLQRTGNLEELWVDKIKSKCIAKYEKAEEAFETRAALHGVNWPTSNPKSLHVDYSTQQVLDDYKARDSGDIKPPMAEKPQTNDAMPVREWDVGKRAKSRSPNRTRRRSRSVSRDRKRSRRSQSPHKRRHSRSPHQDRRSRGEMKEPEPLGKALDELFRKTTTTPSIYWLPLTPEQIAEKEELRRKRMLERERRLAELNKIRPR